jgi:hypothetical protein
MLKAYLICGVLPVLGAVLAANGGLVLVSSMLSLGLLIPVWVVVANLWWVWLLFLPVVVGTRAERALVGALVGAVASAIAYWGMLIWLQAGVAREVAGFTPPVVSTDAQPLAEQPARSVHIITDDQALLAAGPCGALCKGLLYGGVEWLRVTDKTFPREPESHTFERADLAECVARDADLPEDVPCVRVTADRERTAELVIVYMNDDNTLPETKGFAELLFANRLQITDNRTKVILYDRATRHWSELVVPLRFTIDLHIDSTHASGATLARAERTDAAVDPVAALQGLGQLVVALR